MLRAVQKVETGSHCEWKLQNQTTGNDNKKRVTASAHPVLQDKKLG